MRKLALIALTALAGCSTLEQAGILQANPMVQGTIAVASESQCKDFAVNNPKDAQTSANYMQTLKNATEACINGINAGLVPAK